MHYARLAPQVVSSLAAAMAALSFAPRVAAAQDQPLLSLPEVQAACELASVGEHDHLFSVVVDSGWRFRSVETELGEDGSVTSSFVPLDTRRNLRALRGRVEALPSHLETIGFVANEARAAELEAARVEGALLRIGFFLGFDDPARSACLVRGRHGVTMVRMDVAFVELITSDGAVLAREDTDRFSSWSDDHERDVVPGAGPRAAVGDALVGTNRAPAAWQGVLGGAELGERLTTCHRAGVSRGADGAASVRVRLSVDARSGRITSSTVELTNVGDEEEIACIEAAFEASTLPVGPPELSARVEVSVPIRLAN